VKQFVEATTSSAAEAMVAVPLSAPVCENNEASPFFNPFQQEPEVMFSVVKHEACIELDREESIRELYCSSNMARATMEGYPAQNCSAFLCALERNGIYRVHVAFFMTESDRVLVYSPDRQPETLDECEEVTRAGMGFIETVGFMMDKVEIDPGEVNLKTLGGIPELRRVFCTT
ncbi:MAG TPA: hypothetical protein VK187_04955, partial [Geobacteraceae bacterium]|nr:hypothetical protein [Geobacteraceae bacterium]